MSAISQYLERYAETEATLVNDFRERFDSVLVLPCFDEAWTDCRSLLLHKFENRTLIILVLNQADDLEICANNKKLYKTLANEFEQTWQSSNHQLVMFQKTEHSVLLVDRFSEHRAIPRKHGVGLARKIGADIALSLIQKGKVRSQWIHNIDADVLLPEFYVRISEQAPPDAAALILPFEHIPNENSLLNQAQAIYDRHMRYYVAALHWAKSPYAYHSLGSTLVISAQHYAEVRGFPKRSAGEDFHLLNKLRKAGAIKSLSTPAIKIRSRTSHRTPFGTGAAISDILQLDDPNKDYLFYHPNIFKELKVLLAVLPDLRDAKEDALNNLSVDAQQVLQDMNISQALQHASQHSNTEAGFLKHMHTWFDALKTLQFVHGLRDRKLQSVPAYRLDQLLPKGLIA